MWFAVAVSAKICGLTRPEDAELAVREGAAILGVVFAGGPRQVDVARARAIVDAAGAVPVFGVFGDQSFSDIVRVVETAGLRGAQLQEGGHPDAVAALRRRGYLVWRVWSVAADPPLDASQVPRHVDGILLEARVPGGSGGKGIRIPLALARQARDLARPARVVLAGGLSADNVAAAIRAVAPDVVDVSSGVESAPGIKDPARLTRFLEQVRAARAAA